MALVCIFFLAVGFGEGADRQADVGSMGVVQVQK